MSYYTYNYILPNMYLFYKLLPILSLVNYLITYMSLNMICIRLAHVKHLFDLTNTTSNFIICIIKRYHITKTLHFIK